MPHRYSPVEIATVYRVIAERRYMRPFLPDPIDPANLARLLDAAHRGPSVGLMQPWRFVRITDSGLRNRIHALVADERQRTAEVLGPRGEEFLRLKVEGLGCGELLIAALSDGREAHSFGRRTLPEMGLCSVACAIQNLWLAARRRVGHGVDVDVRSRSARPPPRDPRGRKARGDPVPTMSDAVLDAAAILFAQQFYATVASGQSVGSALKHA